MATVKCPGLPASELEDHENRAEGISARVLDGLQIHQRPLLLEPEPFALGKSRADAKHDCCSRYHSEEGDDCIELYNRRQPPMAVV